MGRVGGGLLGAALGAFLVLKLKEARTQAAITQLWALLASKEDPSTLTAAEVGARSGRPLIPVGCPAPAVPSCAWQAHGVVSRASEQLCSVH